MHIQAAHSHLLDIGDMICNNLMNDDAAYSHLLWQLAQPQDCTPVAASSAHHEKQNSMHFVRLHAAASRLCTALAALPTHLLLMLLPLLLTLLLPPLLTLLLLLAEHRSLPACSFKAAAALGTAQTLPVGWHPPA
jgi:hypothetical protein